MSNRPRRHAALRLPLTAVSLALLAACDSPLPEARTARAAEPSVVAAERADSLSRARQDSINRATPGYVVDSILPIDEQLRRFRDGLPRVEHLVGGKPSRDALLGAIINGVEGADTLALRALTVTHAEYAWLVYPTSPFAHPPMQQAPQVSWLLESTASDGGLTRLLARLGGRSLGVRDIRCPERGVMEGDNLLVDGCVVVRREGDSDRSQQLFGTLLERAGSWKVLSWANGF